MRSGGANSQAVSTTCSTSAIPPARWRTFALRDFMRVPRPAARITTVTDLSIGNYYRRSRWAGNRMRWMDTIELTAETRRKTRRKPFDSLAGGGDRRRHLLVPALAAFLR